MHTKPRNEKALSQDLTALNISYFLPLVKTFKRYGGRVVEAKLPLFPGYLFLLGGEDHRYATLTTHRAVQVISVPNQVRMGEELRNVYRVTNSDTPVDLYPGIQSGRNCRVVRGSLAGLEGVVIRRRDVYRVYVAVEILGQSAEVEIDPSLLELLD
ncbi:MAG: transcription termination/antitermination NusG family protein [Planctomycetota bacterium]